MSTTPTLQNESIMSFTLSLSDVKGKAKNTLYPHTTTITDAESFKKAIRVDHTPYTFQDSQRKVKNFQKADLIVLDIDNASDDETEWMSVDKINEIFKDVSYAIGFSRHHNIDKEGKKARPKFHIYFPISEIADKDVLKKVLNTLKTTYPFIDQNALDLARFFFGSDSTEEIIWRPAKIDLITFLENNEKAHETEAQNIKRKSRSTKKATQKAQKDVAISKEKSSPTRDLWVKNEPQGAIFEGTRNSTLYSYVNALICKFGVADDVYQKFLEVADLCEPPLEATEVNTLWENACRYYDEVLLSDPDYILPEDYPANTRASATQTPKNTAKSFLPECKLMPQNQDWSDVGQAMIFTNHYQNQIHYVENQGWLIYNNGMWEFCENKVRSLIQEFTLKQFLESQEAVKSLKNLAKNENSELILQMLVTDQSFSQKKAAIKEYDKFVKKARESARITACLKESASMCVLDHNQLDKDAYSLNTPSHAYDLRKGISSARLATAKDYFTKSTAVNASLKGNEAWQAFLEKIFPDEETINYVQRLLGSTLYGKVINEHLIICYGTGRNGKSLLLNLIQRVLGTYAGSLSIEVLTGTSKNNPKNELALLPNKRFILTTEMEENSKLKGKTIKKLTSRDEITAEKKFKSPFSFTPTHTTVMTTNFLPEFNKKDIGLVRRLDFIVFDTYIEDHEDNKNLEQELYESSAEAILHWLIEGARLCHEDHYTFTPPDDVIALKEALGITETLSEAVSVNENHIKNVEAFIHLYCKIDKEKKVASAVLFKAYQKVCTLEKKLSEVPFPSSTAEYHAQLVGEPLRKSEFKKALEALGHKKYSKNNRNFFLGLTLGDIFDEKGNFRLPALKPLPPLNK